MVLHFNMRHPFHPLCAYWIYPSSYHHGSEKNVCIFNRIVTIQIFCHFPLNHDHGRKNNTLERSLSVVGRMGEKTHRNPGPVWWNHTPIIPDVNPIIINHSKNHSLKCFSERSQIFHWKRHDGFGRIVRHTEPSLGYGLMLQKSCQPRIKR